MANARRSGIRGRSVLSVSRFLGINIMHITGSVEPIKTTNSNSPQTQINLVFVDAGGDSRSLACRAKQLLKLALRGFRLRCVTATGLDGSEEIAQ